MVLATLYVDYFRQFYGSFALNTDASLNLLLADGTILYRRPYSAASIGKTSPRACCSANFTAFGVRQRHHHLAVRQSRAHLRLFAGQSLSAGDRCRAVETRRWRTGAPTPACSPPASADVILLAMGMVLLRQIKHSMQTEAELMRTRDQLTSINQMLEELALLDGLTGLGNRRQFDIALKNELARFALPQRGAADAGYRLLQAVQRQLWPRRRRPVPAANRPNAEGAGVPRNDILARYGGEEMGIILPDTDVQGALIFAERVIRAVRDLKIPHQGNPHGIVTISIGICAKVPHM